MITNKSTKLRTYGERSRYNPFCSPDWRWQTAGKIARKEARSTRENDPALQAAIRLRTRSERGQPYKRPSEAIQAILEALRVYEEDAPLRWEIEARLVVGQTDDEIHRHTGLAPDVISAYGGIFCDVRPYLHADGWLAAQFFGDRVRVGFGNEDVKHIWAWLAVSGQKLLLDQTIRGFKQACQAGGPLTISTFIDGDAPLKLRAFVANAVLPLDYPVETMLGGHKGSVKTLMRPYEENPLPDHVLERVVQCAHAYLDGRPIPQYTPEPDDREQVANTRSTTDTKSDVSSSPPEPHVEGD